MSANTILVTGANGFLGSEVLHQLLESGLSVRATGIEEDPLHKGVEYYQADILQPQQLDRLVENISTVIHTAGLAHVFKSSAALDQNFHLINEGGTANIVSAAADSGVKHFVLVSTVSVYGPFTKGKYDETTPCNPIGPYAVSKYNAEKRALEVAQRKGMLLTILRLVTLYGEGDPGNVRRLINQIDRGRFFWVGDGNNRKSLLYKSDAARACLMVAAQPAADVNVYNISASPHSMREIVNGIAMVLGKKPLPIKIPTSIALSVGKLISRFPGKKFSRLNSTIEKWLAEDIYDTSRIEKDYGFDPKVDLIEGLKREVHWYLQSKEKLFP